MTQRHQTYKGRDIMKHWFDDHVTASEHAGFALQPDTDYMVTWPDRICIAILNRDCSISEIPIDKTDIINNDSPNTGCTESALIAAAKLSVYRDRKEISWFKVCQYGNPVITYLVAATSIDKVEDSLGNLFSSYIITPLDYDGLKTFFAQSFKIYAMPVAAGVTDIMFITKSECCVLRILI